jgi:hypothetical protein
MNQSQFNQINHLTQFNHLASQLRKINLFMQNKPNLCVFWAVSGDCEEKQTQFKPNQTQFQTRIEFSMYPQP